MKDYRLHKYRGGGATNGGHLVLFLFNFCVVCHFVENVLLPRCFEGEHVLSYQVQEHGEASIMAQVGQAGLVFGSRVAVMHIGTIGTIVKLGSVSKSLQEVVAGIDFLVFPVGF